MSIAVRTLFSFAAPGGPRGRLSTLIFHSVRAQPDELLPEIPDARRFDAMLSWVGQHFNVLPLASAIKALEAGTLPQRALAITFDDGYADNHEVALPLLKKYQMTATFFVASDFLDGGRMWNDTVIESVRRFDGDALDLSPFGLGQLPTRSVGERRAVIDQLLPALKYLPPAQRASRVDLLASMAGAALPDDLMMTSTQLCSLRDQGMSIGGHTRSHPILAALDDAAALDEIKGGKLHLERILGESVTLFAYPNGKPGRDYFAQHADMVRQAGFTAAVSTAHGVARHGCDVSQIPRFTPWDRAWWRFGLRMLDNMRSGGALAPSRV